MTIPSPAPSVAYATSSIATPVVSSRFIANNRDVQNAQKKLQYDTQSDNSTANNLLTRPISATLSSTANLTSAQLKSVHQLHFTTNHNQKLGQGPKRVKSSGNSKLQQQKADLEKLEKSVMQQ